MGHWDWLIKPRTAYNWRFVRNVAIKAAILFVAFNLGYALLQPLPWLSQITLYNSVLPGRERLPFAENPDKSYNVTVQRLEGMFASHEISDDDSAQSDEFRVVMLGDSSVWGWLLEPDQTLSACLNQGNYQTSDGRTLRTYNLGYPVLDILKDTMILQEALRYKPDAIVWLTTLDSFYPDEQLRHPIVRDNADIARDLIERYHLASDASQLPQPDLWDRTIIGQRRALADLLRYQVYGLAWLLTGIDHRNPRFYQAATENLLPGDDIFGKPRVEGGWTEQNLAIDGLRAGLDLAANQDVPVLLINEPIFRSTGLNSDVRYNAYYPRWAYDSYRDLMAKLAPAYGWNYLDLWDAVPSDQFTDTSFHLTPEATCDLAGMIAPSIVAMAR